MTLVSLPAGSVPAGKTADGLPVGLQIVAPRFEEPLILSVAKLVQQANPIGWPPYIGLSALMKRATIAESARICLKYSCPLIAGTNHAIHP